MRLYATLFAIGSLSTGLNAQSQYAYWDFCDNCQTDQQYAQKAINSPVGYNIIYVSNRASKVTHKFNKFTKLQEIDGGYVQTNRVLFIDFPQADKNVFERALKDGTVLEARVDRNQIMTPAAGSVATDLQSGSLLSGFLHHLSIWLQQNGYLPDAPSINAQLGLSFGDEGYIAGQGQLVRNGILGVKIDYPDGSSLMVNRTPSAQFSNWYAMDTSGKTFEFTGHDLHAVSFAIGGKYTFGSAGEGVNEAVNNMIQHIGLEDTGFTCRSQSQPSGSIGVTCTRQ